MSDVTRRDILRTLASTIISAGVIDRVAAHEVHELAGQAARAVGGAYTPTALSVHEYRTLDRLTDLIIPAENGGPGASDAGVAAWIDMLASVNDALKRIYTSGLRWLDDAMRREAASDFLGASHTQQTAMLDRIAYERNETPGLAPGIEFFRWARRMTVDGFYTSKIGMRDIYAGNTASATYVVPTESLEYALKRSGLA
ncbi:MAG: gluconate 2-dehydrogenase subunit 3 family protein [Vicinamibacteraceae bacterium]